MSGSSETLIYTYLKKVEHDHKLGNATEHTFRPALQDLLQGFDVGITATNEPKRVQRNAPDYVITRDTGNGRFTVGYVEAKDIVDVSLDKVEHGEQMGRYKRALENLLLTDNLEFRWFVKGEKQPLTARIATIQPNKSLLVNKDEVKKLDTLLGSFLGRPFEHIRRPEELARRMARLTHIIRDTVEEVFAKKVASETLNGLFEAFKSVLLPELPVPQFADMFAQTLAYGLFAARYNHKGNKAFDRRDAAREIPKTNPFLRKLFTMIAGPDFDEEPFIGYVNELTQVLELTDMDAVLADFGKRTRQEDPVVHFYETFLAQYDPKLRELRGVYYTPEPVVSYIVRSVDILLREQFDCPDGLADTATVLRSFPDEHGKMQTERVPRVLLLDPACGTGTFSYSIIDHIRQTFRESNNAGMWSSYVREHLLPRLFGFELLMAPYAVAHLKLGMQLAALDLPVAEREDWAYDFATDERLGVYLTNTLEEAVKRTELMIGRFISDEANEAAKVKKEYPVMVVLGNPPYSNFGRMNRGNWILGQLQDYKKDLKEKKINLDDDFIKFFRFAQWRIEQTGYGMLAFITNNTYINGITHRRMRQSLMETFSDIYILDLHGSVKKKEKSPNGAKDENVFDIQQGVAIGIFVKKAEKRGLAKVHHAELWGSRQRKYAQLQETDISNTVWSVLEPRPNNFFFVQENRSSEDEYRDLYDVNNVFMDAVSGIQTGRDEFVSCVTQTDFDKWISLLSDKQVSNDELSEKVKAPSWNGFDLSSLRQQIQKDYDPLLLTKWLYRPFDVRPLLFSHWSIKRPRGNTMYQLTKPNKALISVRQLATPGFQHVFVTSHMGDGNTISLNTREYNYYFPLYLYPDPKQKTLLDTQEPSTAPGGRRPNLSPAFVNALAEKLALRFVPDGRGDLQETFGPEDVFAYMYAVFHAPTYRARYAEFLKIDFPRLPLTSDVALFRALCGLGQRLVALHLMEAYSKTVVPSFLVKGTGIVEKVEYQEDTIPVGTDVSRPPGDMNGDEDVIHWSLQARHHQAQGRVYINKTQYFGGVPSDVWAFHVGGYQVCHKWLKDRKGRVLTYADVQHYQRVVGALAETISLMERVDETIEEHGGWPLG